MIRFFDIIFSSIALFVLSPLFLVVIILLRFTGEGEIFYQQERVGKNGKIFSLLKFATMLKNSPNIGTGTVTIYNDPRVLPFGKILRKTKINELPQLINVVLGDMSLIGPRPLTTETFGGYDINVQRLVCLVSPGLSGAGSIVFRDEEKLLNKINGNRELYFNIIAPYKGELEVWYSRSYNLKTYFLLILITIYVILSPKSKVFWYFFKSAPRPTGELKNWLEIN